MHSANASFIGSVATVETEPAEKNQSDIYLLWSSVNSAANSSNILYSLVADSNFAVEIALDNESSTILLAEHEAAKVTTALASLNSTATIGLGWANSTNLEEEIGPVRDPYPTVILMTIMYTFILLTGVSGNLLTCLVIARKRYMHSATNYYLFR